LFPQTLFAQGAGKGTIGLGLADAAGGGGARVGVVSPGGAAEKAGVRVDDVVVSVNGSAVHAADDLTGVIHGMAAGQVAHLGIRRGGQRMNIDVTLGGGGQTAGSTTSAAKAAGGAQAGAEKSGPAQPISVTGYTTFTDPIEQAFTIQVPSGWKTVGGLARRAALQVNPYVRSLSPDKQTYLIIGEPTLPGYVPPNQMRNAIGYREGKLFDSGVGGLSMVLHYMPGAEFAKVYGQSAFQGLCSNLRLTGTQERPDMARNADKLVPTVIPSASTGGEARFSCTHHGQEMEARMEIVTRTTRDNVMWNVIFLKGFIAPRSQADKAEEILTHVGSTLAFTPAWSQKQSAIDQQAALAINRQMQSYFRHEQEFIKSLNAEDQNFSTMDEIVSGYSDYHDPATGNNYKMDNVNPFKWADDNTGRVVSTPNNIPPAWGSYHPLQHGNG